MVNEVVAAIVFLAAVSILGVVGVRLGMLLAPRLEQLTEPDDEDEGGPDD